MPVWGFRAAAGFGLCFVLVSLVFVSATSCMSNGTSDGQALEVHLDNPITMTGGTLNSTTTVVNNTTTLIGNTTTQVQNTTTQYPTTTIQNTTTVQNTTTQYPTTTIQNTTTQYPTTTQVNNTTTQISNTTTQVATTTVGCLYGPAASIPAIGSVPDGQMYIDTDDGHWWQAQLSGGTLTEADSEENHPTNEEQLGSSIWFAMSWTPSTSYTMTAIKLYVFLSSSATSDVLLYSSSNGKPSGSVLATYTGTVGVYPGWYTFTGSYSLSSSSTYCWVWQYVSGTGNGCIYGENSGNGDYTTNSGSTWTVENGSESYAYETYYNGSPIETWVEIK